MIAIRAALEENFGGAPAVLLENPTDGQFIGNGKHIAHFWEHLLSTAPELAEDCGIVLDVQQLYTKTKDDFSAHLHAIPPYALKAFHIHRPHRDAPSLIDQIPWQEVFTVINGLDRLALVNPQVHRLSLVAPTMAFCRAMLAPDTYMDSSTSHS